MYRHKHTRTLSQNNSYPYNVQCSLTLKFQSVRLKELLAMTTAVLTRVEKQLPHSVPLVWDEELNQNRNQCTTSFRKSC